MGYDITQKAANGVRCHYENGFLMREIFPLTKESEMAISIKSDKLLNMDISVIGNMGYGTQDKADEIIAEFQTTLDKKLSAVK
jgi:hypothetical protein